jgi:Putative Actinobacterial Holin-X, holin superfamily III
MASTPQMQRSFPEVLQDIVGNLQQIVRYEFLLAKTEFKETSSAIAKPARSLSIGLVLGFYGFGFILLAGVYGLSLVIPTWLAALLVGAVVAIVGAALISSSSKKLKNAVPDKSKTISSLEENVQWAKPQTK